MSQPNAYRLSVEPLQGVENYATWAVQMEDILNDLNLDSHIQDGATGTEAVWKTADRRALTQIRLRIAPHLIVDVRNAKTALEAWTTLKNNYQSQGGIGIILAIRKLFSTRAQDDTDMEDHLRTLKSCAEELRTFGYPLDAKVVSLALLTSMPDSWDSWISAMAIDEDLLKNTSKVTSAITMEARRLTARESNDPTTALLARTRQTTRDKRQSTSQPSASNPTHNSTSTSTKNPTSTFPVARKRCYNCGGIGHLSSNCSSDRDVAGLAAGDSEEYGEELSDFDEDFGF